MRLITRMILTMILGFFGLSAPAFSQQSPAAFVQDTLYPATALLYSQDAEGGMHMRCTATAIGKAGDETTFVTASHCGCIDNEEKKTVSPEKDLEFYITSDNADEKVFEKATVTGCGYKHRGDDFMLLGVKTHTQYPIVKLGNDPAVLDEVINVASPLGLGKQVFIGSVSSARLERPIVEGDINWENVVTLQLFGVNGGSSGSSVVCIKQQAICAFVVGSIGGTTLTAMPVSRLKAMQAGIADKTYKYYVADPDAKSEAGNATK